MARLAESNMEIEEPDLAQPSLWQSLKAKLAGYEVLVPGGPLTVQQGTRVTYKASFFLVTAGFSTGLLLILCAILLLFSSGPTSYRAQDADVPDDVEVYVAPYVRYHLDEHWHGWPSIEHMVVFGDSWSDTRFDYKGARPSKENPLGNPPYPGETSSNIANWIDYLVYDYNQSLVLTANFAIGGATIEGVHEGDDRRMELQVTEYFASLHKNSTGGVLYDWKSNSSLFTIWIGINDVVDHYDRKAPLDETFEMYADLIDWLYQTGARNFFIVDVPPLEWSPLAESHHDFDAWQLLVRDYNHRVDRLTWNFTEAYHDVTTFHFSSYQLLTDVMETPCVLPESCKIKVTKAYCDAYAFAKFLGSDSDPSCEAAVDEYLWLNPLHITTVGHKVIASAFAEALNIGSGHRI